MFSIFIPVLSFQNSTNVREMVVREFRRKDQHSMLIGSSSEAATCSAKGNIINLNDSEVQKIIDNTDYLVKTVIPKDTYPTLKKDVTTFGIAATFVTSVDVSEELVYLVIKAVFYDLLKGKTNRHSFKLCVCTMHDSMSLL